MTSSALEGLTQLAHDRTTRDGLLAQLEVARNRLTDLQRRHDAALASLAEETEDVTRLESMSMTRILASLRGRRDLDLDQERAEAEAARYAAAEAEARRVAAQGEVRSLEARLASLGDLDARHAELLKQREAEVAADPGAAATARQLDDVARQVGSRQGERQQLDEALEAAVNAERALLEASHHLGGAGDWATFDTFFGGGMFTDMAKYDRLDQAAARMREADAALGHLANELADVGMSEVGGVEISQMTGFFDVWFDNIFSDWAVRDRIRQAAERVAQVRAAVAGTTAELSRRREACDADLARLSGVREELLT